MVNSWFEKIMDTQIGSLGQADNLLPHAYLANTRLAHASV